MSPAPDTGTAGELMAPAPNSASAPGGIMDIESIEDAEVRDYVSQKAASQGLNTTSLSRDFVNVTTIEYLTLEVEALKAQLQQ